MLTSWWGRTMVTCSRLAMTMPCWSQPLRVRIGRLAPTTGTTKDLPRVDQTQDHFLAFVRLAYDLHAALGQYVQAAGLLALKQYEAAARYTVDVNAGSQLLARTTRRS